MVITRGSTVEVMARGMAGSAPALFYALKGHRTHKNKPLDLVHNPSLLQLYGDPSMFIASMKSTQCGVSEYLLTLALALAASGLNVFYVLPTIELAGRFVRERFDKTITFTPAYSRLLGSTDMGVSKSGSANIGMKQFGKGTIVFVGSNSAAGFTEFAADVTIIDELDRCDQSNILMAEERLSASEIRRQIKVSNPTVTGFGIDEVMASTDNLWWFIRCPHCGKPVKPDFFKNVLRQESEGIYVVMDPEYDPVEHPERDARLICECGKPIDRRGAGEWVAANPQNRKRGYHFTKLHTTNVTLGELIDKFGKAEYNPDLMTRFHNADLGLAYDAPGSRITDELLQSALGHYKAGEVPRDGACVMGVDVGSVFHVCVGHLRFGVPGQRLLEARTAHEPDELLAIAAKYGVKCLVIDAMPETRVSKGVAAKIPRGYICYYSEGRKDTIDGKIVSVDRTSALDNVYEGLAKGALELPEAVKYVEDFYDHLKASTRIFNQDLKKGEGGYEWVHGSKPDHYHHALGYMLMAGRLLTM